MCGVVSIVYGSDNPRLGHEGSQLLRRLEYRGYDSTGGAFIRADGSLVLRKKVGAPSKVIPELDLEAQSGRKFIGQVRWATYGAVTDVNAQPHSVRCKEALVGAHNGNISNTDTLKEFLRENGHRVVSDNDGEMLVHMVEHFFHDEPDGGDEIARLKAAILKANRKVTGSYAACITLPLARGVFAVKAGSSLYAGKGGDEGGEFIVVSSDLTSVLSKTRFLIPLAEGQGIYFTESEYTVFSLETGAEIPVQPRRSKLNIAETSLQQKYHFFMEQEIHSSAGNLATILNYYFSDPRQEAYFAVFEEHEEICLDLFRRVQEFYQIFASDELRRALRELTTTPGFGAVRAAAERAHCQGPAGEKPVFHSDEALLLQEMLHLDESFRADLSLLDLVLLWKKKRKVRLYRDQAVTMLRECGRRGGRVFFIGSGTSYHAALLASFFFHNLGGVSLIACNPDMFRSFYLANLTAHDLVFGITQSGETKDLVDIFNDIRRRNGTAVPLASIVNNENSTIPQEKSDFFLPILCGPEIAVAATKSFTNQLAVFYILAGSLAGDDEALRKQMEKIRHLIDYTVRACEADITETALKLFLKPSLHILGTSLIGLAREGALKIREVVLNHAEGYDSAEFKHGPNTILGKSTIYSFRDMERLLADVADACREVLDEPGADQAQAAARLSRLLKFVRDFRFGDFAGPFCEEEHDRGLPVEAAQALYQRFRRHIEAERYFSNYPLIFVCPPDERDKRITITQIHTHKIRGADIILIAEEDAELRKAVEGRPAAVQEYYAKYIVVPGSGDRNVFVFQAAVILQLLALKMSVAKMKTLNTARIENHGVHPDVPKNVSKSITVD